ncbi:MAG TPA: hypothetical protein VGF88_22715 [Acidobacteriaceae bacterium]
MLEGLQQWVNPGPVSSSGSMLDGLLQWIDAGPVSSRGSMLDGLQQWIDPGLDLQQWINPGLGLRRCLRLPRAVQSPNPAQRSSFCNKKHRAPARFTP